MFQKLTSYEQISVSVLKDVPKACEVLTYTTFRGIMQITIREGGIPWVVKLNNLG